MARLRRDFLPADLQREIAAAGIDGVVSVQARQSLEETRWLLELAEENDFIRGVVGWVPLRPPTVAADWSRSPASRSLKAVRHVLQDEPIRTTCSGPISTKGFGRSRDSASAYDILIYERQLPQTIRFVDRHPRQTFMLDHVGKPQIRDESALPVAREHPRTGPPRACLLQNFRHGDRGRLAAVDGRAASTILGDGARGIRPAAIDVRLRLAGLPGGLRICQLASAGPRFHCRSRPGRATTDSKRHGHRGLSTCEVQYELSEIQHGNRRSFRPSRRRPVGGVRSGPAGRSRSGAGLEQIEPRASDRP